MMKGCFEKMGQIGRNEKCPCGSGKKYKKCCGRSSVVSIDTLRDKSIKELQWDILRFAIGHYHSDVDAIVNERMQTMKIPDQDSQEAIRFMLTNWAVFNKPVHNGQRVIDLFIEKNLGSMKRPQLKEILPTWSKGLPVVAKVASKENGYVTIEDVPSGFSRKVKIIEDGRYEKTEIGNILLGIVVPIGEQEYNFFTSFFDIPLAQTSQFEKEIKQFYETNGVTSNVEAFTAFIFPDFLELLLLGGSRSNSSSDTKTETEAETKVESTTPVETPDEAEAPAADLEWIRDEHKAVADLFQETMKEHEGSDEYVKHGLDLWNKYCQEKDPNLRKPAIYAAAVHYLVDGVNAVGTTQKAVAELYGVSAASMAQKYRDMADSLENELKELSAAQ